MISTTSPASSGTPSVSTSDMNLPICRGGKFTTASTRFPTSFLAFVPVHKRVEIGWTWYARRVWAGAVNPSCKRMLMAHGFETLELNRVELKADARNTRSCRAMERFGAKFEGVHRAHMVRPDGRLRDTAWYSVIREEWPAVRDGLDARLAAFSAAS